MKPGTRSLAVLSIRALLALVLLGLPMLSEAATKYWIGPPGGLFSTAANWTTTPGQACGVGANTTPPTTTDIATFDTCSSSAGIIASITIAGMNITSNYTVTITHAAGAAMTDGSVDLTLHLGASAAAQTCSAIGPTTTAVVAAALPWLQGRWNGAAAYDQNPATRASFGQHRSPMVYMRENF
jgi:hypothetical protein